MRLKLWAFPFPDSRDWKPKTENFALNTKIRSFL